MVLGEALKQGRCFLDDVSVVATLRTPNGGTQTIGISHTADSAKSGEQFSMNRQNVFNR